MTGMVVKDTRDMDRATLTAPRADGEHRRAGVLLLDTEDGRKTPHQTAPSAQNACDTIEQVSGEGSGARRRGIMAQAPAEPSLAQAACIHHWLIGSSDNGHAPGKCVKCGDVRTFATTLAAIAADEQRRRREASPWPRERVRRPRRAPVLRRRKPVVPEPVKVTRKPRARKVKVA